MNQLGRTIRIIDERIANIEAIELRGNIPSTSTSAAKLALLDLKRNIEEDAEIGRQLLAVM